MTQNSYLKQEAIATEALNEEPVHGEQATESKAESQAILDEEQRVAISHRNMHKLLDKLQQEVMQMAEEEREAAAKSSVSGVVTALSSDTAALKQTGNTSSVTPSVATSVTSCVSTASNQTAPEFKLLPQQAPQSKDAQSIAPVSDSLVALVQETFQQVADAKAKIAQAEAEIQHANDNLLQHPNRLMQNPVDAATSWQQARRKDSQHVIAILHQAMYHYQNFSSQADTAAYALKPNLASANAQWQSYLGSINAVANTVSNQFGMQGSGAGLMGAPSIPGILSAPSPATPMGQMGQGQMGLGQIGQSQMGQGQMGQMSPMPLGAGAPLNPSTLNGLNGLVAPMPLEHSSNPTLEMTVSLAQAAPNDSFTNVPVSFLDNQLPNKNVDILNHAELTGKLIQSVQNVQDSLMSSAQAEPAPAVGERSEASNTTLYVQRASSKISSFADIEEDSEQTTKVKNLLHQYLRAPEYADLSRFSLGIENLVTTDVAPHTSAFLDNHKALVQALEALNPLVKPRRHRYLLSNGLVATDLLSFTQALPTSAFIGMTEILPEPQPDSATQPELVVSLVIPPFHASQEYEQVSTAEIAVQADASLYLSKIEMAHFSMLRFEDELTAHCDLNLSYERPAALLENAPHWINLNRELDNTLVQDEPDFEVTNEVHKTLDYVIHHHEKFKHDNYPELLTCMGRWCFDRDAGGFYIDQAGAKLFGLKPGQVKLTHNDLYKVFHKAHVDRIVFNHNNPSAGNIISDRLLLISGPYAGKTLMAQGAVVIRDPETNIVLFSSGFLCYEYCPHADFLCREIMGDGMFIWDTDNDNIIVSPSYHLMLGYTKEEFPTKTEDFARLLVHPDDDDAVKIQHMIVRSPAYGNSFESCIRLRHKSGKYIWTIGRGVVIERNSQGVATKIIGSQTNIDLVHKSFENIGELMFTDSLTELHNRSYLTQNAIRFENQQIFPLSVLFVDVTGLKLTNDILGHNFGDYLILKCVICLLQALQQILGKFNLLTEYKNSLSEVIDHLTHKAFAQIFQNKDLLERAEKLTSRENLDMFTKEQVLHFHQATSFGGIMPVDDDEFLDIKPENIEKILHQTVMPEIIRLSGDELIMLFPSCSFELAKQLEAECLYSAKKMNAIDRISFPAEQRPVPLCFGIGTATVGELGPNDTFKQALERADMRMLQHKESTQPQNHKLLQEYYESRLKRKVSMRDSRRTEILSENERQKLRDKKLAEQEQDLSLVTLPIPPFGQNEADTKTDCAQ